MGFSDSKPALSALTVWQPWAWAISVGEKIVENRDWAPPPQLIGRHFAVHAGKTVDRAAYEAWGKQLAARPRHALWTGRTVPRLPEPHELVLGAVVAVARLAGAILAPQGAADGVSLEVRRILQPAAGPWIAPERAAELARNRYASGPWLWVLEDVVQLAVPIPCRGAQKIWTVPDHEAELVRASWAKARSTNERSTTT